MDIFASINAGTYKNALPYASPKEDRAVFDAYKAEEARLFDLFVTDLRASLGMEPGPAFDALFAHAWEKGHSSGFSEVAIEAGEAADLLKVGAKAERERIRRKLLAELGARRRIVNVLGKKNTLAFYLDEICPEEK